MTLTKPKPRRTPANHSKRTGQHHSRTHRYVKMYWPYLPMVAILALSFVVNSWLVNSPHGVLGYATDVSVQNLYDGTNAQRSANGEAALALNSQLDQAAQAKANDMAARDYWSHNTPDGQTPWTFIVAAGYSYQTAGENLAYGFDTSAGTISGWMNSPEHRANILNTAFKDVGFGIANAANYQGSGPQTIVVAMYAAPPAPVAAAATPEPAAPTPIGSTPTPAAPAEDTTPLTTAIPSSVTQTPESHATATAKDNTATKTAEPAQKHVPRIQLVATNQSVSWTLGATTLLTAVAVLFVVFRHGLAWRKVFLHGERFVLHHPLVDIAAVFIVAAGVLLTQTAGLIR